MAHRPFVLSAVALASAGLVLASAAPASAHAIVGLNGDPAYAGQKSAITLELQHGCLSNELGIDKVVATFDKSFGKVRAKPVQDWTSKVRPGPGGIQRVVWTLTGPVPAFNQPTFFRLEISWPKKPGVYGVPVTQQCDGEVNRWQVPDGPATANQPSPPLYPLPQIKVLPAP